MAHPLLRAGLLAGAACLSLPAFAQEELPELVVTPNRLPKSIQEVGSATTVITREEIEREGPKSLHDVLNGQPGVQTIENGGPGGFVSVFMRGTESRHTLVLIDGVRIGDPTSTGNEIDLSLIPPGDIDRIEIVRGPQSALYGSDAIGGVINIITKRARKGPPVWRLRTEGGSYGTFSSNLSVSGATDDLSYSFGFDQFHSDGFKRYGYRVPRLAALDPSGSDPVNRYGVYGRVSTKLNDWLTFESGFQGSWSKIQFDGGENSALAPFVPNFQTAWQGSAYQKAIAESGPFRTTLTTFETRFVKDLRVRQIYDYLGTTYDDQLRYNYRGTRLGAELQEDIKLNRFGTMTLGARYEQEKADTGAPQTRSQSTRSAYALYQVSPIERLDISLGARLDDVTTFGSFATYRATASYMVAPTTRAHGSIGTGAKAPSLYQLFDGFYGNLDLKAETSTGYDVGIEQTFLDGDARVDVTYFHNKIANLIDFVSTGPFTGAYFNVNKARISGVEVGGDYNLMPAFAKLKVAYTWLDTHIDPNPTDPNDVDNGAQLLRRPRHALRASIVLTPTRELTIEPIVRFIGARADKIYDVNFNEVRVSLKPYTRFDLVADYKLNSNVSVFARGENLTNVKYENVYNYGTAGRSVYAGVQMTW
ncbi:MAG: TonB-dependent receptor [Hyphomicrobiales bacterium]|nr:TonB-dependent receptor [Hyphomicrobiales bacterium]